MATNELIYYVAQSLDGFITDKQEKVDWLDPYGSAEEDYGYNSFYDGVDSLIMGGNTFRFIQQFGQWPYPGKPTWVLSGTSSEKMDEQIRFSRSSPLDALNQIHSEGFNRIWLVGGGKLAKAFLEIDRITEFIITVIPVILGSGLPLLSGFSDRSNLRLIEKTVYDDGVVQLIYRPV